MIEPLYSFMFSKNIGIGAGITLLAEQFGNHIFSKENISPRWVINKDQTGKNILFRSNMVFHFPILKQEQQNILFLTIEPGLFLNPINSRHISIDYTDYDILDFKRYKDVKSLEKLWLYYNLRTSIAIDLDMLRIGLGYTITNYDLYDNIRTAKIGSESLSDYLRKKRLTHCLEAYVSYKF